MVTPTKKTSSKKGKLYNPYTKRWVEQDSEEGKKLKKLIKTCKKCPPKEIYDSNVQKCVKRTPKNLVRLKDFDKFCKVYRLEKIKLKDTDKLVFGKILNAKLPGGNFKIRDIIGNTRVKVAAYELEKENKDKLKIIAAFFPIVLAIAGIAISNPPVFRFIKEKIYDLTKGNPFFTRIFSKIFKKGGSITSEDIFIPGQDNLQVNLNKDDYITKQFIEKHSVGSVDTRTNIAMVNTNKLGIKGINPFTDLSKYVLSYDVNKSRYSLTQKTGIMKPLYDIANSTSDQNVQIRELTDIVTEYADRKAKVNLLTRKIKLLGQQVQVINEEKKIILKLDELLDDRNKLVQINIDIKEKIQELEEERENILPKTSFSLVNQINKLIREQKNTESKIFEKDLDIEKQNKKNESVILKYKNKSYTVNEVESIVSKFSEISIISKKANESNINALALMLEFNISRLENKINKYNNLDMSTL